MKGEEHILVNFPIDTSLKKKAHSGMGCGGGGGVNKQHLNFYQN